jgi:hypothetical protein
VRPSKFHHCHASDMPRLLYKPLYYLQVNHRKQTAAIIRDLDPRRSSCGRWIAYRLPVIIRSPPTFRGIPVYDGGAILSGVQLSVDDCLESVQLVYSRLTGTLLGEGWDSDPTGMGNIGEPLQSATGDILELRTEPWHG